MQTATAIVTVASMACGCIFLLTVSFFIGLWVFESIDQREKKKTEDRIRGKICEEQRSRIFNAAYLYKQDTGDINAFHVCLAISDLLHRPFGLKELADGINNQRRYYPEK